MKIGVRYQTQREEIGKVITHKSNVWVQDEMLAEKLNGVCAVSAPYWMRVIPDLGYQPYGGEHALVLISLDARAGEDDGEIIMSNPVVFDVINPDDVEGIKDAIERADALSWSEVCALLDGAKA